MKSLKQKFKYYFLAVLALACGFVWYAVAAETRTGLRVAFLDVGQGDAIFIEASNGNQVLLDGGPNKKVLGELGKVMPFYDRSIDMIIESHPDADHVNGLVDVLNKYNVDALVESGVKSDQPAYLAIEKMASEKKIQKILARRGTKINLGNEAIIEVLFPDRNPSDWETNTASLVVKLTYGKNSFLLTGDSPSAIEEYLVSLNGKNSRLAPPGGASEFDLKSDVLKVGHHGSKTSSSESFVGWVSPQYAVISVGADNRYGHPHQETLDTLNKFKIPILRTDENGTVVFESDGEGLEISTN